MTALLTLFVVHRATTWNWISPKSSAVEIPTWRSILIGLCSDIWIAVLLGILSLLIIYTVHYLSSSDRGPRWTALIWTGVWGLLMVGHQSYVEFFHHNIMPFHVRYLMDPQFLTANSSAALNPRGGLIFGITLVLGWWIFETPASASKREQTHFQVFSVWCAALVLGLGLHAANIRWRVNWFIPTALQVNFVEKFFIDLKIARVPPPLTKDELRALARDLHVPALEPDAADRETLEKLLLADTSSPPPITEALKAEFEKLRAEDEKPIIAIVLMETLRATEVGFMNPNARSLTPNLDAAAHKGIYFSKAYSTGTVTRSGQEAVWCGYPSGQDSSMMRGRPDVRIPCLTKVAASENRPLSLWLHGGDGRFDGQRQFWIDQGTDITMALEDFPADAPRTGWGIGDIAWAETALQKLKEARTQTQAPWILAMFLSVTNHIPWQVPGDAPDEIKEFAKTATHRKYATTKYSDAALGRLITGLKSEGLWDKSILFVTGDHGNLEKPWVAPQGDEDAVTGNLLSHVPLVVTGGLPEKVRQKNPVMSKHIPWYVSIAGIAPTIAGITSIKGRWLGRDIFEKKQPTIWVDLGHALFVPATKEKIERSDVMQQRDFDEASQEKSSAVLHYRALNHLINEWGLSKKQ